MPRAYPFAVLAAVLLVVPWAAARLAGRPEPPAERIEDRFEEARQRAAVNELLTRDLVAGRRPLAGTAELMWELNRDAPGYKSELTRWRTAPTPVARTARLLMHRVERMPALSEAERAVAVDRLGAEYEAAFGPPPPDPGRLARGGRGGR